MRAFETPAAFARACVGGATALLVLGIARIIDRANAFPLAGLLLTIAALTWVASTDRLDDPPPVPTPVGGDGPVRARTPQAESIDGARDRAPVASGPIPLPPVAEPPVAPPVPPPPSIPEPTYVPEPTHVIPEPPRTVEHTFRLPAAVGAHEVWLVGDFNDWSATAHPMQHVGDAFTCTVALDRGRAYRYRFLLDGVRWENDWAADAYEPNGLGSEDSVIHT